MSDVFSFIFARGGSQGLKNKNILNFAGKPLIAWTIEQALGNSKINRVIVSTDSPEIAHISKSYGAEVPFLRPDELASNTSSEIDSWKHALNFLKDSEGYMPNIFISLPCTSPLRSQDDIDRNLDCLIKNNADLAISVSPSSKNPYFNIVRMSDDGQASLFAESECGYSRRQDAPVTFDITTVAYSSKPEYILNTDNLMSGRVFASVVDKERSIDIDTLLDFRMAELLYLEKNGNLNEI